MASTNKSDSLQRPEGRGFSPTLLMKMMSTPEWKKIKETVDALLKDGKESKR